MMAYVIAFVLLAALLLSGLLERYYTQTPLNELKRRARGGDSRASLIHEVARNPGYAKIYLNILSLIIFSILIAYLADRLSALELAGSIMAIALLWLILTPRTKMIAPLAVKLAPSYAVFIVALKPYVGIVRKAIAYLIPGVEVSNIYEKEDLIGLIERQKTAVSNRIEKTELDLALHALTFGEKRVKDYMTPRKVVRFVASDEPVSPILMDELHQTGFSRFPVYLDDIDNVVGTLYLKSLVERKMSGKVFTAMTTDVYEVAEDENLESVLQKFLKTKHHLFVVRNDELAVSGIITIEDVIGQILGRKISDKREILEDASEAPAEPA